MHVLGFAKSCKVLSVIFGRFQNRFCSDSAYKGDIGEPNLISPFTEQQTIVKHYFTENGITINVIPVWKWLLTE